jgi:hypothetical protein
MGPGDLVPQLLREIAALRTLIGERITATETLFDTKIQLGRESGMALKELLESKLDAQQAAVATSFDASEKSIAAALLAAKEAVEKANVANDKRFDSVNEFRQQLADMQNTLIPRNEADARFNSFDARIVDIKSAVDKGFTGTEIRTTVGKEMWGYAVGIVGLIAVVATTILAALHFH